MLYGRGIPRVHRRRVRSSRPRYRDFQAGRRRQDHTSLLNQLTVHLQCKRRGPSDCLDSKAPSYPNSGYLRVSADRAGTNRRSHLSKAGLPVRSVEVRLDRAGGQTVVAPDRTTHTALARRLLQCPIKSGSKLSGRSLALPLEEDHRSNCLTELRTKHPVLRICRVPGLLSYFRSASNRAISWQSLSPRPERLITRI